MVKEALRSNVEKASSLKAGEFSRLSLDFLPF
jgi:hypothetical protein